VRKANEERHGMQVIVGRLSTFRAAANADLLQVLEAAMDGKAQPKDIAGSLKAALDKAPELDLANKLPDLLWLVGESCVEAGTDEKKSTFKALIQQLLVCASPACPPGDPALILILMPAPGSRLALGVVNDFLFTPPYPACQMNTCGLQ
jgi:hypothetical protein